MASIIDNFIGIFRKSNAQEIANDFKEEITGYLDSARQAAEAAEKHALETASATEKQVAALTAAITQSMENNKTVQAVVAELVDIKKKIIG